MDGSSRKIRDNLLGILQDKAGDLETRRKAAWDLADRKIANVYTLPILISILSDPTEHWEVQWAVAETIGELGYGEAINSLEELKKSRQFSQPMKYLLEIVIQEVRKKSADDFVKLLFNPTKKTQDGSY
jgi:HEAT repeat protein